MPLSTQSASRERWNHRSKLIFSGGFLVRITLLLLRVQYAAGRWFVRTIHPDRMINTMIKMFRKCCQPSQAGNPTGAPADRWDSPGKARMNDCTAGSRRNHWAMSTVASRSTSATGITQRSLNHLFLVIGEAASRFTEYPRFSGSRSRNCHRSRKTLRSPLLLLWSL